MKLGDRERFLSAMRDMAGADEAELARLAAIWPSALAAASACRELMPSIGILSPRKRERAFVAVTRILDARIDAGEIDHEQAQLALTILRMGDRRFRRAEAGFLARLGRRRAADIDLLPETARHYLHAIKALRERRPFVEEGRIGS